MACGSRIGPVYCILLTGDGDCALDSKLRDISRTIPRNLRRHVCNCQLGFQFDCSRVISVNLIGQNLCGPHRPGWCWSPLWDPLSGCLG
ncbi:hypothetical protein AHAS_Ahas02G0000800 [Arachis hypogaea]